MEYALATGLLLAVLALGLSGSADGCKVLSVVTNVATWTPTTGPKDGVGVPKSTGYWLSEFTHSYTVFRKAGCSVTVASPKGGKGAVDPQGFAFYANDPDTQALVRKDAKGNSIVPQTESTLPLRKVEPLGYDIVFFVGGTGAMWDFKNNSDINRIVRQMWEAGKVVSAVCHGPMALTTVKLSNGKYLVDGKLITAFSNAEEVKLGKANVCALCGSPLEPKCIPSTCNGPNMVAEYPRQGTYLIEDKLKERGASYVATFQDWDTFYFRPHVVRDGRLVTGQNPGAGRETAEAAVDTFRLQQKWREGAAKQLQYTQCTKIHQRAGDPPVVCTTTGPKPDPVKKVFVA